MGGFLLNSASLFSEKGIFLNHHYNNFMLRKDKMDVKSYEVGFKNRSANLKKVFGEFFEREILINNNDCRDEKKLSTSLINGEKTYIDLEKLIARTKFVDSCGMASHTKSNNAITTAFLEFFERQSLIVNYLTKKSTKRIILWEFDNYNDYLLNYVDKIYYYNISLSPKVYVVLTLGIGSNKKCAGLGTAFNLGEAVKKSQIEALQYFATEYSKYQNLNKERNYDSNNKGKDLYHENFDSLSVSDFKELYSYLLNAESMHIEPNKIQLDSNYRELLEYCKAELNMKPNISMFPNYRKIPHLKIVKVYDENWFPHLNPLLYSQSLFENISKIIGRQISKEIKFIPFP